MKTMNRNAQRSHRMLLDAFVQLLAEKPYDKITVTDVTKRAGLNRGTFYAHFNGIADLFDELMGTFSKGLSALVERVMSPSFLKDPMPVLDEIGDFLSQNRERMAKLVSSSGTTTIMDSLEKGVKEQVRGELIKAMPQDPTPALVSADYLAGGILRAYEAWLAGDYGTVSIETVNEYLGTLVKATLASTDGWVSSPERKEAPQQAGGASGSGEKPGEAAVSVA